MDYYILVRNGTTWYSKDTYPCIWAYTLFPNASHKKVFNEKHIWFLYACENLCVSAWSISYEGTSLWSCFWAMDTCYMMKTSPDTRYTSRIHFSWLWQMQGGDNLHRVLKEHTGQVKVSEDNIIRRKCILLVHPPPNSPAAPTLFWLRQIQTNPDKSRFRLFFFSFSVFFPLDLHIDVLLQRPHVTESY